MPDAPDMQQFISQIAAQPHVRQNVNVDGAQILEAITKLSTDRTRSLLWGDAQLMGPIKDYFLFIYDVNFKAAKGGFFSGRSNAEAATIAIRKTTDDMREILAAISLGHGARLQQNPAVESLLLGELVAIIGRGGFPVQNRPPAGNAGQEG
jgi:hypothetical protein